MTVVDVWLTAPRAAVSVRALLTGDEWLRLLLLRRPDDRNRSATGRALTRLAVAGALHRPHGSVRFDLRCGGCGGTDHGKPYVRRLDADEPVLDVSVSHAGGLVAVSLAPVPVGLDVEESAAARFDGIARVVLHPAERARLGTDVDARRLARIWVRKEALLKVDGTGLARDPADVDLGAALGLDTVVGPPGSPIAITDLVGLPDGYLGAVAVTGSDIAAVRLRDAASLWAGAVPAVRTPTT